MQVIARLAVANLLPLVMLLVGLRASAPEIAAELRRPKRLLIGAAAILVAVPLIAIAVVRIVPLPARASVLFLLFAICPAAPFSMSLLQKRERGGAFGIAFAVLLLTSAIVTVPAWIWILDTTHKVNIAGFLEKAGALLAIKIMVPLGIGMLAQKLFARAVGILVRVVGMLVLVCLAIAVVLLFFLGASTLSAITLPVAFAAVLIVAADAFLVERLAPADDPVLREAIATVAVRGNPALALAVISLNDPTLKWAPVVAAYLILRTAAAIPIEWLARRGRSGSIAPKQGAPRRSR